MEKTENGKQSAEQKDAETKLEIKAEDSASQKNESESPSSEGNSFDKRIKELTARLRDAESKLTEADKKAIESKEEEAKKRGEFEKLYNESKPQAERAKALEGTLQSLLDEEVEALPEKNRELLNDISDLPIEKRLAFIRKYKKSVVNQATGGSSRPPAKSDAVEFEKLSFAEQLKRSFTK